MNRRIFLALRGTLELITQILWLIDKIAAFREGWEDEGAYVVQEESKAQVLSQESEGVQSKSE